MHNNIIIWNFTQSLSSVLYIGQQLYPEMLTVCPSEQTYLVISELFNLGYLIQSGMCQNTCGNQISTNLKQSNFSQYLEKDAVCVKVREKQLYDKHSSPILQMTPLCSCSSSDHQTGWCSWPRSHRTQSVRHEKRPALLACRCWR